MTVESGKTYEYWIVATSKSPMIERSKYKTNIAFGSFNTMTLIDTGDDDEDSFWGSSGSN